MKFPEALIQDCPLLTSGKVQRPLPSWATPDHVDLRASARKWFIALVGQGHYFLLRSTDFQAGRNPSITVCTLTDTSACKEEMVDVKPVTRRENWVRDSAVIKAQRPCVLLYLYDLRALSLWKSQCQFGAHASYTQCRQGEMPHHHKDQNKWYRKWKRSLRI